MRDILVRLREDAGQLTLAILFQEREAAACEIERLRRQLELKGMFSPYQPSSTDPACGCQKGTPLAIDTPHLTVLRYVVRAALYSGP